MPNENPDQFEDVEQLPVDEAVPDEDGDDSIHAGEVTPGPDG